MSPKEEIPPQKQDECTTVHFYTVMYDVHLVQYMYDVLCTQLVESTRLQVQYLLLRTLYDVHIRHYPYLLVCVHTRTRTHTQCL